MCKDFRNMTEIESHQVCTLAGTRDIMSWVEQSRHRNPIGFDAEEQVELFREIASLECEDGRKLALRLIERAAALRTTARELEKEMATVGLSLQSINKRLIRKQSDDK